MTDTTTDPPRPATRGELAALLKQGVPCEVAAFVEPMTTIQLRWWLGVKEFHVTPSANEGWVIYRPGRATAADCPGPRTEPLKAGDHVQIVPEWQDPGDDKYARFVIEAPADSSRVKIRTIVPGLAFHPVEWIEADRLVRL